MNILLLDIESSPNTVHTWGLFKQNIALNQIMETSKTLCWAAKWLGKKGMMFSSRESETEMEMLEKVHALLSVADAVIHFNGKSFDIATLNKEFIINGMLPPTPYHQIDLLLVAKKEFRFVSNKMDHLAQQLGIGKKVRHEGHELWVKCMNNDPQAWKKMRKYNERDVTILEKLYYKMLPWIKDHPNHALYVDIDRPICTNCGSRHVIKRGIETTSVYQYKRYTCKQCGTNLRERFTCTSKEKRKAILTQSKL